MIPLPTWGSSQVLWAADVADEAGSEARAGMQLLAPSTRFLSPPSDLGRFSLLLAGEELEAERSTGGQEKRDSQQVLESHKNVEHSCSDFLRPGFGEEARLLRKVVFPSTVKILGEMGFLPDCLLSPLPQSFAASMGEG